MPSDPGAENDREQKTESGRHRIQVPGMRRRMEEKPDTEQVEMNDQNYYDNVFIPIKPLSVNRAYTQRARGRGRVSTQEHRDYKKRVSAKMLAEIGARRYPVRHPLVLEVKYFLSGPRIRQNEACDGMPVSDVTNYDKPLLDAIEGVLYEDDNQIRKIILEKIPTDEENQGIKISWSKSSDP